MHKTAAWPLALIYVVLVVYASLFPFSDWRVAGVAPWEYLLAPLPRYWTGFDVAINVVGYIPLGGLLALTALRTGRGRYAIVLPLLLGGVLSASMETLQTLLPMRVPSKEDLILNALGALLGAVATLLLERWGAIDRWSRFRARWFQEEARGGIVLLATWPLALLFPAPVPFGLGQVLNRLEQALSAQLQGTPFFDWLPQGDRGIEPLLSGAELVCVTLGLLIPCLLAFCVVRAPGRRAVVVAVTLLSGVAATALSSAMSWGPEHAWAWLDLPTQVGLVCALVVALSLVAAPWRASAALALLALGIYLSLLNQAPESPYFAQTLMLWEQGRFMRFNGLSQWLGWLWPYAALVYVLARMGHGDSK
jgi:VanZ family protein